MDLFCYDESSAPPGPPPKGWKFADPPNLACISLWRIFDERRLVRAVYHDHDGGWQFLDGFEASQEDACVIGLVTALDYDDSLEALFDLPRGWGASRREYGGAWDRFKNEQPADENA